MKKILAVVALFVLICGCSSSSSSGGGENNQDRVYSLYNPNALDIGKTVTSRISGSDSKGFRYSGSSQSVVLEQTTLDDIVVTKVRQIRNLTVSKNGQEAAYSFTSYAYYKAIGILYKSIGQDGKISTALTFDNIPNEVRIGDFGPEQTIKDGYGQISIHNWQVIDGGGGNAKIILTETERDTGRVRSRLYKYVNPDGKVFKTTIITYVYSSSGVDTITLDLIED